MERIPNLYKRINTSTIPKIIIDELKTNSNEFTKCYEWDSSNIETETIIGKELPLFINFKGIYNFFINDTHYSHLERMLIKGICFDENYNKINCDNIYDYLEPYNRGFIKGYFEFESSLKKDNNIFNVSNEMLSYNIYSRIKIDEMMSNKSGGFTYCTFDQNTKDVFKKIKKENNLKSILLLTEENIFKSGFEGGEFYKAWELILNNPTLFEPIFLANANTDKQPKPEAIENLYLGKPTNEKANKFFEFLIENYNTVRANDTKVKFVNILHFLKNDADKKHFIFKLRQDQFNELLEKKNIEKIKKFAKSASYDPDEIERLRSLENTFLKTLN